MTFATGHFRNWFPPVILLVVGCAIIHFFPGSPEQDSGYHYQMARSVLEQPDYLVQVWARPLFTAVFFLPSLAGHLTARYFALLIAIGVVLQTIRLGDELKLERTRLMVPLLFLSQPVFVVLFTDLLTEPLFALLFVTALRWHLKGKKTRAVIAASFLPLARPEGFFLCLLWGGWLIFEHLNQAGWDGLKPARLGTLLAQQGRLLTGVALWWVLAWFITGDRLFIIHNWPAQWHQDVYLRGGIFTYASRAPEAVGLLLIVPFLAGLWIMRQHRPWMTVLTSWLLLFGLHTIFVRFGLFGEAGFPRYMIAVAPATALITLAGWNQLSRFFIRIRQICASRLIGTGVLAVSIGISVVYLDGMPWARDTVAIQEMLGWADHNTPGPVRQVVWSNIDMCRRTNPDFTKRPSFGDDRMSNLSLVQSFPVGTLVLWDNHLGPGQFKIDARDIESAGFTLLRTQIYQIPGVVLRGPFRRLDSERTLTLSLLYKQ